MKFKFTSAITYCLTILVNLGLGILLNYLFYKSDTTNVVMFACGVILVSTLIVHLISQKLGFKLDIFAYEIDNNVFLLLNDIFIGNLFSIPLSMFLALLV